ncbi:MAG: hypothetical protein IPK19_21310 [Chloroflexi bacterium]|nr:hypothetical protein [Chloroflexota bacterium]
MRQQQESRRWKPKTLRRLCALPSRVTSQKYSPMLSRHPDGIRTYSGKRKALTGTLSGCFSAGEDLRGFVPFPSQTRWFAVLISAHEQAVRQNPDKQQLREAIFQMSASGMSYREIGTVLGLHWTRVGHVMREERSR